MSAFTIYASRFMVMVHANGHVAMDDGTRGGCDTGRVGRVGARERGSEASEEEEEAERKEGRNDPSKKENVSATLNDHGYTLLVDADSEAHTERSTAIVLKTQGSEQGENEKREGGRGKGWIHGVDDFHCPGVWWVGPRRRRRRKEGRRKTTV